MIVGIDASNISGGGGVTHLAELLAAAEPASYSFTKVVVWAPQGTLDRIPDREWLMKEGGEVLTRGILWRSYWQRTKLKKMAKLLGCDVLFVPGGNDVAGFFPTVSMSQNMLPFEWKELRRFGWSLHTLRFVLLRYLQARSFRRAAGVVYLTEYARDAVTSVVGKTDGLDVVIPHGLNQRFFQAPRLQRPIKEFTSSWPCRVIYVSIVHCYKHQWAVVEAVSQLRQEGLEVVLELVGPPASGSTRLKRAIFDFDPDNDFVIYRGEVSYNELHLAYAKADIGVFASSCENLPNILLENMAAGLPIACSELGPMPEVLGDAGVFFDPQRADSIADALRRLVMSSELRTQVSKLAFEKASCFTWQRCAEDTFRFLSQVGATSGNANGKDDRGTKGL